MLFAEHPLLGDKDFPVHQGGPVGLDTLQILHRVPEIITGGAQIGADLYIGGDLEAVGRYAQERSLEALRTMRLLVGYAGWSPGQLEFELENGSWLPAHAEAEWLLSERADSMWKRVVRGLGDSVPGLGQEPPDPSWN
jgi:putative transcriptional regulator